MFDLAGYGPQIFSGTVTTIELSILSLIVSFLIGLAGASAKLSKNRGLKGAATVYTTIIRGVPDLVLMLLIFYSLQIWINDFTDWLNSLQSTYDIGGPARSFHQRHHHARLYLRRLFYRDIPRRVSGRAQRAAGSGAGLRHEALTGVPPYSVPADDALRIAWSGQ